MPIQNDVIYYGCWSSLTISVPFDCQETSAPGTTLSIAMRAAMFESPMKHPGSKTPINSSVTSLMAHPSKARCLKFGFDPARTALEGNEVDEENVRPKQNISSSRTSFNTSARHSSSPPSSACQEDDETVSPFRVRSGSQMSDSVYK